MTRATYRFSRQSETDFDGIGEYSMREWGEEQAFRYLASLTASFQKLAEFPALGRRCENVRPGLRRLECGKHVIFYREKPFGVLISRILHERMSTNRQTFS